MQKILAREEGIYLICGGGTVWGVLYFNEGSVLLPCLPMRTRAIACALADFFADRTLFCLMGKAAYVRFLHRLFTECHPQQIRETKHFIFMEHTGDALQALGKTAGVTDYRIFDCIRSDADRLMPLHLGYVREEVLFVRMEPNAASERLRLEHILEDETVLAAEADGILVAKAQTNAKSRRYIQIGGVYTLRAHRGRGLACALVSLLAERAEAQGRKAVLFVRESNKNACRAYRNAGFVAAGAYIISYYSER